MIDREINHSTKQSLWKTPDYLLHGADYCPEQWPSKTWREDIQLMQIAGVNVVSIGMFAWSRLETAEGVYDFHWLDEVLDLLEEAQINVFLATPSGTRPPWLAQKYPEVLRVANNGQRNRFGFRHNHCLSSPVYRKKVAAINRQLAQRYGHRSHVMLWHISNEYSGACYCELCQDAFRSWLQKRYLTLDTLNDAWWTTFWSHRYTDWSQIEAPCPHGEFQLHGLNLDWKRFTTTQTVDFMEAEIAAIRQYDQTTPATTNTMGIFEGIDCHKLCSPLDIVSWDAYPNWHNDPKDEITEGSRASLWHDLNRSLGGGRPFLLMESTPSFVNWQTVNYAKQPGMHKLASLQAVAHGADSVQYFQWRASRGGPEKFHGAVIGHGHNEHDRVYREVCELGDCLAKLKGITGTTTPTEVAIVYDWENRWAYEDNQSLRNDHKGYLEEIEKWHRAFWLKSIPTDIISEEHPLDAYKLVVAPLIYLLKDGFPERLENFVKNGGQLVITYGSAWVNHTDLIFEGGQLAPLHKLLGIRALETFVHREREVIEVTLNTSATNSSQPAQTYSSIELSELIECHEAEALGHYTSGPISGTPCLSRNKFGDGYAMYLACRGEEQLINDLVGNWMTQFNLSASWPTPLPYGVHTRHRQNKNFSITFLMNFTHDEQCVETVPADTLSMEDDKAVDGPIIIPALGVVTVKTSSRPASTEKTELQFETAVG
ncbi:beta-galactosidase [Coraliomargarita sp. SDUM461004]|uniref:Beta-galactosidase n=1 Tax=Thalassobacterium sedimentorum TaxID=3041258 RepID=A0ABU1AGU8_9BACT|nr:beta-galactosidase [Coraliomargarita sp. SDUM461004]MDQ8194052.1 beta-galactosidase [Coraliomargarita sp. SDUM461004]